MKKRNLILLFLGILPIIVGLLCNTMFMPVPWIGTFLMTCGPWIWLAVCIAAADRKGRVLSQSLLLFAVGLVMIVLYFCYQSFWGDTVSIFSPLNIWPQYYLSSWILMAARINSLTTPNLMSSDTMLAIASVLSAVFTFAGVFIKTRFKNYESEKAKSESNE